MAKEAKTCKSSIVYPGECKSLCGPSIWLMKPVADGTSTEVVIGGRIYNIMIATGRSTLIASTTGVKIVSREGAWEFQEIPIREAAKLLVFLECDREESAYPTAAGEKRWREPVIDATGDLNVRNFERWLIGRAVKRDPADAPLFDFLRAQETYGLVRFLLKEHNAITSIAKLSQRYGVSESHFRRLCRQALGKGLKRELRQWRAAMAVLDVVESGESLTQVASSHGFSSSSHFSREIRDLFGFSPSQVRRRL
ncbi:hypothetical protein AU476_26675 [Cupriavidus sp. UYMSc13B]|nr:hypothetical protein AU476_26675 [Cupriavidus sp. UYMSc13B]